MDYSNIKASEAVKDLIGIFGFEFIEEPINEITVRKNLENFFDGLLDSCRISKLVRYEIVKFALDTVDEENVKVELNINLYHGDILTVEFSKDNIPNLHDGRDIRKAHIDSFSLDATNSFYLGTLSDFADILEEVSKGLYSDLGHEMPFMNFVQDINSLIPTIANSNVLLEFLQDTVICFDFLGVRPIQISGFTLDEESDCVVINYYEHIHDATPTTATQLDTLINEIEGELLDYPWEDLAVKVFYNNAWYRVSGLGLFGKDKFMLNTTVLDDLHSIY